MVTNNDLTEFSNSYEDILSAWSDLIAGNVEPRKAYNYVRAGLIADLYSAVILPAGNMQAYLHTPIFPVPLGGGGEEWSLVIVYGNTIDVFNGEFVNQDISNQVYMILRGYDAL